MSRNMVAILVMLGLLAFGLAGTLSGPVDRNVPGATTGHGKSSLIEKPTP